MSAMTDKIDTNFPDALGNAEQIIERFGGIRPMASKMHVPVTTVQGWKKRNVIPGNRRDDVLKAAQNNNIDLSDVIGHAANENGFAAEMMSAAADNSQKTQDAHEEAVKQGAASAAPAVITPAAEPRRTGGGGGNGGASNANTNQDAMIRKIRESQKTAVTQSFWLTLVLVALTAAAAAVLLWPAQKQVTDNAVRLSALETEVQDIRDAGGTGVSPDFIAGFEDLKARTAQIEETVAALGTQIQNAAGDVIGPDAGTMPERLAALEAKVTAIGVPEQVPALIEKLRELQQSAIGQGQIAASVSELRALVEGLQGRMDGFDAALATAQQGGAGASQLGQTLEGVPQADLKAAAMLVTLSQLRSALGRDKTPFAQDLALMKQMVGTEDAALLAAIDALAPQAEKGVLTPDGLKNEFKGLAGDIVVASLQGEDVSVREKALARLGDVLQVKKDGALITGTDTQAIVARAQAMLDSGDVQGAINELRALDGEAAAAVQPFIGDAEATLAAGKLQDMLAGKIAGAMGGLEGLSLDSIVNQIRSLGRGKIVSDETGTVSILP